MVRREVNRGTEERGRKAVLEAAFVLANGDELLRSRLANALAHGVHPIGETFLGEHLVVVDPQRVAAVVHAARGKVYVLG